MGELLDKRLETIARTPVQATWSQISPERAVVDIRLPVLNPSQPAFQCRFGGVFDNGDEQFVGTSVLMVNDPELQGHGIGERLVRSLGALSNKYGFRLLKTELLSEYALDIDKRVYGEDRLNYISVNHGLLRIRPKTYDQARKKLVRFGRHDPGRGYLRYWGIYTNIDLEGLDMSDWELPVESSPTPGFNRAIG
jgi:hypothetical protein